MGQYDPREHGPLQAAVFCPAVAPTRPAAPARPLAAAPAREVSS